MRIALLTLEALANARAVRRFVAARAADIALVGLSDPFRRSEGGMLGRTASLLRRSGPRLAPYLALNFALPRLDAAVRGRAGPGSPEETPLARLCPALGIPAVPVADVNGTGFRDRLAASGAELLLSFHFDQIIAPATLALLPRGGINVHPSLLPRHRGPAPTLHALAESPVRLGVSIHRLSARIDAGPILAQTAVADRPGLSALGAAAVLHEAALPLLDVVLEDLAAGLEREFSPKPQPYRGFPTAGEMRALARAGRRAVGLADLRAAWATPILPGVEPPPRSA